MNGDATAWAELVMWLCVVCGPFILLPALVVGMGGALARSVRQALQRRALARAFAELDRSLGGWAAGSEATDGPRRAERAAPQAISAR
jgi:hypothetical protein